jgi:hypothetical protein
MSDNFGNYFIQKLAEICSEAQLTRIIKSMEKNPLELSKDTHGTRSVQKLIEIVKLPKHFKMIQDYFINKLIEMSHDINGNHVIQKIL